MMTYTRAATPLQSRRSLFRANARRILAKVPHVNFRAVRASLSNVDQDIERTGGITYETVMQVRATLALLRLA